MVQGYVIENIPLMLWRRTDHIVIRVITYGENPWVLAHTRMDQPRACTSLLITVKCCVYSGESIICRKKNTKNLFREAKA